MNCSPGLLFVFLFLCIAKTWSERLKFCPNESEENFKCLSRGNSFKCGVFFLGLPSTDPFRWIAALPDALSKPSIRRDPQFAKQILNGISRKDFVIDDKWCSDNVQGGVRLANGRCYSIMNQLRAEPLDSCDKNLINSNKAETVGNILCSRLLPFFPLGQQELRDVQIGFAHSVCGNDWTSVVDSTTNIPLTVNERLCCRKTGDSEALFFRCDGSSYVSSCV